MPRRAWPCPCRMPKATGQRAECCRTVGIERRGIKGNPNGKFRRPDQQAAAQGGPIQTGAGAGGQRKPRLRMTGGEPRLLKQPRTLDQGTAQKRSGRGRSDQHRSHTNQQTQITKQRHEPAHQRYRVGIEACNEPPERVHPQRTRPKKGKRVLGSRHKDHRRRDGGRGHGHRRRHRHRHMV